MLELKECLSQKLFDANGLSSMLSHVFDGSPYKAIDTSYPKRFKKSDFKSYRKRNLYLKSSVFITD